MVGSYEIQNQPIRLADISEVTSFSEEELAIRNNTFAYEHLTSPPSPGGTDDGTPFWSDDDQVLDDPDAVTHREEPPDADYYWNLVEEDQIVSTCLVADYSNYTSTDLSNKYNVNLVDGYGILDIGCSKGLISEHALRGLLREQKKNGVLHPLRKTEESKAKFTFGDGTGKATKAGRKVTVAVAINGKPFETEFECLNQGKTPPLISLPQMENLHIDISLRPGCSTISSEKLGFKDKPLERQNGHVVLNLAELFSSYVAENEESANEVVQIKESVPPVTNLAPRGVTTEVSTDDPDQQDITAAAVEKISDPTLSENTDSLFAAWDAIIAEHEKITGMPDLSENSDDGAFQPITESDKNVPTAELNFDSLTALDFSGIFKIEELTLPGDRSSEALEASYREAEVLLSRLEQHLHAAQVLEGECLDHDPIDKLIFESHKDLEKLPKQLKTPTNSNKNNKNNKVAKGKKKKTLSEPAGTVPTVVTPTTSRSVQCGPSRKTVPGGIYTEQELLKIHSNWNHCSAGQLKRRLGWGSFPQPRLSTEVLAEILTKCPHRNCQALVHAPRRPKASGIVPETRNQFVAQDTVFPTSRGRKWCVQHRVDCLTKLTTVYVSATNKATDSIKAQQEWFTFYGANKHTLTDNGSEYINSAFTEHCQRNGCEHYTSPAYAGFSNGMIERSHQECKRLFELVSNAHPQLPIFDIGRIIQQALNENIKGNGRSSFENHFGKPHRKIDVTQSPVMWEDAIEEYQRIFEEALDTARIELVKLRTDVAFRKALQNQQNRSTGNFTQGDKVWWFQVGKPNELPRWKGPARCLARQGSTAVIMEGGVAHMVHVSRVRCFKEYERDELPNEPEVINPAGDTGIPDPSGGGAEARTRARPSEGADPRTRDRPSLSTPGGARLRSRSVGFDINTIEPRARQGRSYIRKDLRTLDSLTKSPVTVYKDQLPSFRPAETLPIPIATDTSDVPVPGRDVPDGTPDVEDIAPTPRPQVGVRRELTPLDEFKQLHQERHPLHFRISETPPNREDELEADYDVFDHFSPRSPVRSLGTGILKLDDGDPEDIEFPQHLWDGEPSSRQKEPPDDLAEVEVNIDTSIDGHKLLYPGVPENPVNLPKFPYPFQESLIPPVQQDLQYGPTKRKRNKIQRFGYDGPAFKEKTAGALVGNLLDELKETSELNTGKSACAALLAEMRSVPNLPKPDLSFLFDTSLLTDLHDPAGQLEMAYEAMVKEMDILENCYKSRLVAEDTPMRDMRPEEITQFKELVDQAQKTEFDSFLENDAIDFISKKKVKEMGRRIMPTRQLMQWKEYKRKVKCRLVLKGFKDDRELGAVDSPTLRQESFKLLLQYSCDKNWDLMKDDLKTAFLQGFLYENAHERVYFHPSVPMREYYGLHHDDVCVAKRSIYGLNDAPRRWYERLSACLMENGWERHWLDPCLFHKYDKPSTPSHHQPRFGDISSAGNRHIHKYENRTCIGSVGVHVDDLIRTGTPQVLRDLNALLDTIFTVGTRENAEGAGFLYRGLRVRKPNKSRCIVHMQEYEARELDIKYKPAEQRTRKTAKDEETTLDQAGQEWFRAAIGKLIWCTCQVRLDLSTPVSQAASSLGRATFANAITVNALLDQARERKVEIVYQKITNKTRKRVLKVCCDAAFKNKMEKDCKSRGGMLLLLGTHTHITDTLSLLGWSSKKIARVCKSPTGAEILTVSAAIDEVDFAYHLAIAFYTDDLEYTSEILTDSLSLTSTQDKYTKEINPNLQVDVSIIRQKVRNGDTRLTHIPGLRNPSDGLTKVEYNAQKSLLDFLDSWKIGKDGTPYENLENLFTELMDKVKVNPADMEKALREYVKSLDL